MPRRRISPATRVSLLLALAAPVVGILRGFTRGLEVSTAVRGAVTAEVISAIGVLVGIVGFIQTRLSRSLVRDGCLSVLAMAACLGVLCVSWLGVMPAERFQTDFRSRACRWHLEALCRAVELYSADNDSALPLASRWCDNVSPYLERPRDLVCPEATDLRCGYAYNARLSGARRDTIGDPGSTILIFESDAGWNAAGGRELLPRRPRHTYGSDNYALLSGRSVPVFRKHHRPEAGGDEVWSKQSASEANWMQWQPVTTNSDRKPAR